MQLYSSHSSMVISPTRVLATYSIHLFSGSKSSLGSPGNAKNCVNVNKYPTGELGGFPGEQRATMWEKNLGDRLTVLCSIYAAM